MFSQARIRLTAWYTLAIMLISTGFSLVMYRILDREVDRFARMQRLRTERQIPLLLPPPMREEIDRELITEARERIVLALGIINLGILGLAMLSGYWLAGRTLQPIAEMVREQNRFVSDASHELRTPLTALKSAVEVYLRDKQVTLADSRQLARESLDEINRIQTLADAMLLLAQSDRPQQHSRRRSTAEVGEIITRATARIRLKAKTKHIKLETDVRSERIPGDTDRLTDLVTILLDNAVKYSHDGGRVLVRTRQADRKTEISVTDSGIGIDEKDLPHIFERFYRADTARIREDAGGYGLGLPIAKKIAEDHGGKIEVRSRKGEGSVFTLILPAVRPETAAFS